MVKKLQVIKSDFIDNKKYMYCTFFFIQKNPECARERIYYVISIGYLIILSSQSRTCPCSQLCNILHNKNKQLTFFLSGDLSKFNNSIKKRNKKMTWFPFQYRDIQAFHKDNLPLSTSSNEAAKLFDSAITQLAFHDVDPG